MRGLIFYIIFQLVLLLTFLLTTAHGEELGEELLHTAAHVGASYLITHSTEVVCTKIAGKEHRLVCTLVGASVAASAGIIKEVVVDKGESSRQHTKGYLRDGLGIGLAIVFITIDW